MKKVLIRIISAILIIAACIPLASCNSTEESIALKMDEVIQANTTEAVLKSYDNYFVKWSKPRDGMPQNTLISKDFIYCDDGNTQLMYLLDSLASYEKLKGGYASTVRFEDDVKAFVGSQYFKSPLVDSDASSEAVLSSTADGHNVKLTTRLSDERAKRVVESFADTGKYEYVKASYLLDRDSLKIIELTYYRVKEDGTEVEFAKARAEYNSKGNWDIDNMFTHATKSTDEDKIYTVTVELMATDKKTIPATVREGDILELRLGEEYQAIYLDEACSMPYKSNGKYDSDMTLYCVSSSALPQNVSFDDVIAQNTTENILKNFDNYRVQHIAPSGKVTRTLLMTKDYSFISAGAKIPALYLADGRSFEYEREHFVATIRRPEDVAQLKADNFAAPLLTEGMSDDEIIEIDAQNSYFYITSRLTDERAEEFIEYYELLYDYSDIIVKYTVNRSPLFIDSIEYYGRKSDGKDSLIVTLKATYNATDEKLAEKIYDHVSDTTQKTRTITVTLDPDTPDECVLSATAVVGDPIAMRLGSEYKTAYTDRECTIKYRSNGKYDTDEFLYCKRQTT